jgi:hypothetical protein
MSLEIEILNWDRYNPRRDVKKPSWFRMQNDLFFDPSFFDFRSAELLTWIFLLTQASVNNRGTISLSTSYIASRIKAKEKSVNRALEKLEANKCIKIRNGGVTRTSRGRNGFVRYERTNGRTNGRDEGAATRESPETTDDSKRRSRSAPPADRVGGDIQKLIAGYIDAYRGNPRYGRKAKPHIDGKVRGRMATFLKDVPLDRALLMVQIYLQIKDPWFEQKCHDWETFMQNMTKIGVALDTGRHQGRATGLEEWAAEKEAESEPIGLFDPVQPGDGCLGGSLLPESTS